MYEDRDETKARVEGATYLLTVIPSGSDSELYNQISHSPSPYAYLGDDLRFLRRCVQTYNTYLPRWLKYRQRRTGTLPTYLATYLGMYVDT